MEIVTSRPIRRTSVLNEAFNIDLAGRHEKEMTLFSPGREGSTMFTLLYYLFIFRYNLEFHLFMADKDVLLAKVGGTVGTKSCGHDMNKTRLY